MSGIGTWGAGSGAAGYNLIGTAPDTRTASPEALLFDVVSRDILVDADGNYVSGSRVDSEVLIALGIHVGGILSERAAGGTLSDLEIDEDDIMTAEADRRVRLALSDLVTAGDVEVVEVTATSPNPHLGRARVFVAYHNLRLPSREAQSKRRELTFG